MLVRAGGVWGWARIVFLLKSDLTVELTNFYLGAHTEMALEHQQEVG